MPRPRNPAPTGKKITMFLRNEVIDAIERHWRDHIMRDRTRCDSKSAYISDLILRDTDRKRKR